MEALIQAHVTQDIMVYQFDGVVANITAYRNLISSDKEFLTKGARNKALHISMKCLDNVLERVLVDLGSSLNVMPKSTLAKFLFDGTYMKLDALVVKVLDGSRRTVIGEVDLPILIVPHIFEITFQMMDISSAYNFLLGRPWIHTVSVVTSILHQKLKFVIENKLIIIYGEEDMLVSHLSSYLYIKAAEESLENSFQAL